MAYDPKEIYDKAMAAIKKNNLWFIEDVVAYLPVQKSTFYSYFPLESNEMNAIKAELEENKIKTKSGIRKKLFEGKGGGSGLIALYKLLATDEERKALTQQYFDHTTKGKELPKSETNIHLTADDIKRINDELESEY